MAEFREIPDSYPVRVFISKEEGWTTEMVPVDLRVHDLWNEPGGIGERWSPFWEVSSRWVPLYNKFLSTGDEKVSAELRQLERLLLDLEAAAAEAAGVGSYSEQDSAVVDELAERRAHLDEMRSDISL